MPTNHPIDCENECHERQEAEINFVKCAYMEEEAWVSHTAGGNNVVHRRLDLQFDEKNDGDAKDQSSGSSITIELVIILPLMYPVDESSIAHVDISVLDSSITGSTVDGSWKRKLAMNSTPSLLQACRDTCKDFAGQESVFAILSRAEEWLHQEWKDILLQYYEKEKSRNVCPATCTIQNNDTASEQNMQELVLARKLIFSHHIIAKSKRKAIGDLSREYKLGGYTKIGWPGIIIVEGEESDCNRFIDEIKGMRWQYLVVRGEEFEHIANGGIHDLDKMRRFPIKMEELAEDQISYLANVCREVGLETLFKSFMNIKDKDQSEEKGSVSNNISSRARHGALSTNGNSSYGALVHVDHMNHKKGYEKWIEKACKSEGCSHAVVRCCHANSNDCSRPLIFVFILSGDMSSIKQVIKKWRTSKVDVDSKGVPCLERMMSVIVSSEIKDLRDTKEIIQDLKALPLVQNDVGSFEDTTEFIATIGGPIRRDAIDDYLS
jgi:Protein of unknown function (DUF1115).